LTPDLIDDAVHTINSDLHLSADSDRLVIRLLDPLGGDPRMTVLRVLGLVGPGPAAVQADTPRGGHVIGIWSAPDLVLVQHSSSGKTYGFQYSLRGYGPGVFWKDLESLPRARNQWNSEATTPEEVRSLFDEVGLSAASTS
jgi:hypothetical protein